MYCITKTFFSILILLISCIYCTNNITEPFKDSKKSARYEMLQINNTEKCGNKSLNKLWSKYHSCISRQRNNSATTRPFQKQREIVRAYVGSVARLPCNICVSPTEITQVEWMYSESINNLSFIVLEDKESVIMSDELVMYHVRAEHAGVYQCRLGQHYGAIVLLEVTDADNYTVVKPPTSHGPYPSPPRAIGNSLIVFTHWGRWSECSTCNSVGRRRRYGICYVAYIDHQISNRTTNRNSTSNDLIDDNELKIFLVYPKGIPCFSKILHPSLRSQPDILSRSNEIMIGMCKVPCKDGIFEIRSAAGEVIERANNSAGVYSLCQNKPLQTPPIARNTMFVLPGSTIHIPCPGTILRDIPATWRIGNERASPRLLHATTRGRVHINARDHIAFSVVEYSDTNVYSCWQADILAGVVKLKVSQSAQEAYRRRFTLVATIILLILLLNFTRRLSYHILRHD